METREIVTIDADAFGLSKSRLSSLQHMKNLTEAKKWTQHETDKFFMALQVFGADFTMIAKVFAGERSREQIRNKFRKEERLNKDMIDKLLKNKEKVTLKDFYAKYGQVKL
jgi:Myb DNA-binding like